MSPDRFRLQLALPPIGPGSRRMALSTLRRPLHHTPAAVLGGWLPRGVISTAPIRHLVDRLVGEDWPQALRVVTCDYRTGRRAVFGDEELPAARLSDAVAASCAIPGFYHPVAIGGWRFVDGGVCSMSNLELLCREDVDVAIVLNPTSSRAQSPRSLNAAAMAAGVVNGAVRGASARRLDGEVRKLRATGVEVVVIEPSAADLAVRGHNPMSRRRRAEITELAYRSVSRSLRRRTTLPDLRSDRPRTAAAARAARNAGRPAPPVGGTRRAKSGGPRNRTSLCGFGDRRRSRWTSPPRARPPLYRLSRAAPRARSRARRRGQSSSSSSSSIAACSSRS